jgi:hypothetical protein
MRPDSSISTSLFPLSMLSYDAASKGKSSNLPVGSSMTLLHTATDLLSKIKSQYPSGYGGRAPDNISCYFVGLRLTRKSSLIPKTGCLLTANIPSRLFRSLATLSRILRGTLGAQRSNVATLMEAILQTAILIRGLSLST